MEELQIAANLSNVLSFGNDYLTADFRRSCKAIIPEPEDINPNSFVQSYLGLKYSKEFDNN